ncbi:MAG: hypothetical protein A3B72_02905 [Omnitrophica bacterium RIFCSPHIGHO2_02_FULL_45_28]|nr:MAG: hypothetical protein A3B72_02905 [Omnitrophica bacterium RIFCSPHIGHO2_02_FULL_45_28]
MVWIRLIIVGKIIRGVLCVVVLTYKRASMLRQCLDFLIRQATFKPFKISFRLIRKPKSSALEFILYTKKTVL